MSVEDLMVDLAGQNVRLWAQGRKLKFAGPEGALTKDVLEMLRRNKPAILK